MRSSSALDLGLAFGRDFGFPTRWFLSWRLDRDGFVAAVRSSRFFQSGVRFHGQGFMEEGGFRGGGVSMSGEFHAVGRFHRRWWISRRRCHGGGHAKPHVASRFLRRGEKTLAT